MTTDQHPLTWQEAAAMAVERVRKMPEREE
jgi:hypothetical protein